MKDKETKDKSRDVFISYASDKGDSSVSGDRQAVDNVCSALESRGIRCWIAPRDILSGAAWGKEINTALTKARVLVLVFTSSANNSNYVELEVHLALKRNIPIIPIQIGDFSPGGTLEFLLANRQWIYAQMPPQKKELERLIDVVSNYLGKGAKISKNCKVNKQTTESPKEEVPEDVRKIAAKIGVQKVIKNDKDSWEADYGDGIIMVYIPEGEFKMGSDHGNSYEKPEHKVYLDGYWMGKIEVTVGQFRRFFEDEGYKTDAEKCGCSYCWTGKDWEMKKDINWKNPGFKQDDNHPVVCVSWYNAQAYCEWLSDKKRSSFKLPTEAQWEKAASGCSYIEYPWGYHEPYYNTEWYANYAVHDSWERKGKDGFEFTAPVGSYPKGASPYGLLDMAGNVWEWCRDWYGSGYYSESPERNPPGPKGGTSRVLRGGSWNYLARYLRCSLRYNIKPSVRVDHLGFRLCQDSRRLLK